MYASTRTHDTYMYMHVYICILYTCTQTHMHTHTDTYTHIHILKTPLMEYTNVINMTNNVTLYYHIKASQCLPVLTITMYNMY